jgi:hypothetical protein
MSDLKTIKVTMNWDNWKQVLLKVPAGWDKSKIKSVLVKKYGTYDIKEWVEVEG